MLLGALVLVAAGVGALWPRGPKEPVYQGKPLSYWLEELGSTHQNTNAPQAIRHMGKDVLPFLRAMLTAEDSSKKLKLLQLLSHQSLFKLRHTPASEQRYRAVKACLALGPLAAEFAPEVLSNLNQPGRMHGMYSLYAYLEINGYRNTRPGLIMGLTNSDRAVREFAVAMIANSTSHQDVRPAIPLLLEMVRGSDTHMVLEASNALYKIDPAALPR